MSNRTTLKRAEGKYMIEEYLKSFDVYRTIRQIKNTVFSNEVSDRFVWNALEELIKEKKVEKRLFIRNTNEFQNGGVVNGYRWIK